MLVDFPAGFIDIMDCLAEYIADRILFLFTADDDSLSRLIRCYCAVRARSGFRCGRTCLRKGQRRDKRASESHNCLLHDDASLLLLLMFYLCFVAPGFNGRLPRHAI
jgi:hypothetical protein